MNYCVSWVHKDFCVDNNLIFHKSYFDESYFEMPVHDSSIVICNRKMSTYINTLAKAGFMIEQWIEESDTTTSDEPTEKSRKAQMLPLSFVIKARKL